MEPMLSHFMQQLLSQELPMLDSADRARVTELLREHAAAGGGTIETQEDLPGEIRQIMDL
ncbi:hypothetical protein M5J20_08090 [Corynebacterium sp. TA-R-1]|uniref:Uncharacterized protein n=1 Tax=Corynebacterium stercoris TaxID=2943490 RepID=A0ABT1G2A6_9CORY|nr:hypothetical protein [Corynebacterium stercoris]MCP1388146.1 hypothetical protein [Corynebacterium stercoris]